MDELARRVEEFGTHPFLVTTSREGRAHVVSITVALEDAQLSFGAGRTSRANAAEASGPVPRKLVAVTTTVTASPVVVGPTRSRRSSYGDPVAVSHRGGPPLMLKHSR